MGEQNEENIAKIFIYTSINHFTQTRERERARKIIKTMMI
jgi:hypothetical protein